MDEIEWCMPPLITFKRGIKFNQIWFHCDECRTEFIVLSWNELQANCECENCNSQLMIWLFCHIKLWKQWYRLYSITGNMVFFNSTRRTHLIPGNKFHTASQEFFFSQRCGLRIFQYHQLAGYFDSFVGVRWNVWMFRNNKFSSNATQKNTVSMENSYQQLTCCITRDSYIKYAISGIYKANRHKILFFPWFN